jgi:hypothetical protein
VVPLAHFAAATTTPAETSSLWNFLSSFYSIICVAILFTASLIRQMMILHDPLSMSYFFFISLASAFSFVLSSGNCVGSSPRDSRPVMYLMSSTSIEMIFSSHRYPPCVISIIFLTQFFSYWPLPKCGRSNRPRIPVLGNLVSH